jgi:integrase
MACVRKRRGRYVIDFYDQDGRRRWETLKKGSTLKEANERLGEIEKNLRRETYIPNKSLPSFKEVADAWLASRESSLRHSTFEQYKGHVTNHLKPYFGAIRISQVNFDRIEQFKQESLKRGVTHPTLRKILINLGAILTYAVRMRYIDFNPAREVEKPKGHSVHGDKDEMIILKPPDIRALLDAAATEKDRVLFMAAVLTGMREGELLGLKWDDFDWRNGQVHVRRSYNHGQFYEPKTKASRRKIDLPPELMSSLKRWQLQAPISEHDLVFPTEVGTPEGAANMFYRRYLPTLRRAGLPRIRFHNLRHTYASLLINQGEHPKYIQSQMGHSSINVTMDTYGHLMNTINRDAASKLGEQVLGGSFQGCGSNLVADN